MKITIDDDVCRKNDMDLDKLLLLLTIKLNNNIAELLEEMLSEKMIIFDNNDMFETTYLVTSRWNDIAETIILDSDKDAISDDRIDNLVIQLQELFPKGKKDGTSQYWRGNKREIGLRLKKFFKLYGNTYTDEQILEATKNYVETFDGRYSYMRVLKYFIWKDERRTMEDGTVKVVEVSDLANYIENIDNSETLRDDWTSTLN